MVAKAGNRLNTLIPMEPRKEDDKPMRKRRKLSVSKHVVIDSDHLILPKQPSVADFRLRDICQRSLYPPFPLVPQTFTHLSPIQDFTATMLTYNCNNFGTIKTTNPLYELAWLVYSKYPDLAGTVHRKRKAPSTAATSANALTPLPAGRPLPAPRTLPKVASGGKFNDNQGSDKSSKISSMLS